MHNRPTPLLGGFAIWLSVVALIVWFTLIDPVLVVYYLKLKFIIGIIAASAVLIIGGYLDDRFHLPPSLSIWFPILAALIIIGSGVGINFITRPGGGVWRLDGWKIELLRVGGLPYYFNVGADLLTFFWLMGMMYTTKLLDGLDGLTSGLTVIGAIIIVALSFTAVVHQPDTALLAGIVAGAFLGFLWYNWFPASIFLGEGGSLLAGFMLGVLAIIAGGKIATTLLIVGIPAFDVAWVIIRRIIWERTSIAAADRKHLHFRLLDAGLSSKQAVILLWTLSAVWGMLALFLQTRGKFVALIALGIVAIVFAVAVVRLERQRKVQS
jgi:UDP-GlcNAc:undecaprenyl-phosphate GlcNAc-1-phosphate transferase